MCDKDKCLEIIFGDAGQVRTDARTCKTVDNCNLKPKLRKTKVSFLLSAFILVMLVLMCQYLRNGKPKSPCPSVNKIKYKYVNENVLIATIDFESSKYFEITNANNGMICKL